MLRSKWIAPPLFHREIRWQQRTTSRWLRQKYQIAPILALVFFVPVLCSFQYGITSNYYATIMVAEFAVWIFHALTVLRMVRSSSGQNSSK